MWRTSVNIQEQWHELNTHLRRTKERINLQQPFQHIQSTHVKYISRAEVGVYLNSPSSHPTQHNKTPQHNIQHKCEISNK